MMLVEEEDEEGIVYESRVECDMKDTMTKIGAYPNARFAVVSA